MCITAKHQINQVKLIRGIEVLTEKRKTLWLKQHQQTSLFAASKLEQNVEDDVAGRQRDKKH